MSLTIGGPNVATPRCNRCPRQFGRSGRFQVSGGVRREIRSVESGGKLTQSLAAGYDPVAHPIVIGRCSIIKHFRQKIVIFSHFRAAGTRKIRHLYPKCTALHPAAASRPLTFCRINYLIEKELCKICYTKSPPTTKKASRTAGRSVSDGIRSMSIVRGRQPVYGGGTVGRTAYGYRCGTGRRRWPHKVDNLIQFLVSCRLREFLPVDVRQQQNHDLELRGSNGGLLSAAEPCWRQTARCRRLNRLGHSPRAGTSGSSDMKPRADRGRSAQESVLRPV